MKNIKQVISFRGNVADDIARKVLPTTHEGDLTENLYKYFGENSDNLVCSMEADIIVICKRAAV